MSNEERVKDLENSFLTFLNSVPISCWPELSFISIRHPYTPDLVIVNDTIRLVLNLVSFLVFIALLDRVE